jgi:multidrug efflux pump
MALFGFSINSLTLLALVLAIGLVVDDSIVVLENIYRYIEQGMEPFAAAIKGVREIGFAVVAMTMTLVAVFAPLAFTPGRTGRLFAEFALALAGSVIVSGVVALSLSPMMCSKLLKHNPHPSFFDRGMGRLLEGLTAGYGRLLRWTLTAWRFGGVQFSRRWLVVGVMLLAAYGSYQLFINAKSELAPMEDRGVILVIINGPDGATLDYTSKYVNMLEKIGRKYSEFNKFFAVVGNPTVAQGAVFLGALPWGERKRSTLAIALEMMPAMGGMSGVMAFPITPPSLGQAFRERPFRHRQYGCGLAFEQARDQLRGRPRTRSRFGYSCRRHRSCGGNRHGRAQRYPVQAGWRTIRCGGANRSQEPQHAYGCGENFCSRARRHHGAFVRLGEDERGGGAA